MTVVRRVLLTGASGFVGRHLASALADQGREVHALVRASTDTAGLQSAAPQVRLHRITGDAASVVAGVVAAAPDVCWHLATHFRGVHTAADVDQLLESNVTFGTRLAEGLAEAGTPVLVNTGTAWQHYRSAAYSPTSLYAATKQAYEDIVSFYAQTEAFRAVNVKLFDTYGPNDPRGKLISVLLDRARSGGALKMSPGEQFIDLVHVRDVVAALIAAPKFASPQAPSYQVSSGSPLSLRALVRAVERVTGKSIPVEWGARPYRPREMMEPWEAGSPLPQWQPDVTLEDGLRDLWAAETTS